MRADERNLNVTNPAERRRNGGGPSGMVSLIERLRNTNRILEAHNRNTGNSRPERVQGQLEGRRGHENEHVVHIDFDDLIQQSALLPWATQQSSSLRPQTQQPANGNQRLRHRQQQQQQRDLTDYRTRVENMTNYLAAEMQRRNEPPVTSAAPATMSTDAVAPVPDLPTSITISMPTTPPSNTSMNRPMVPRRDAGHVNAPANIMTRHYVIHSRPRQETAADPDTYIPRQPMRRQRQNHPLQPRHQNHQNNEPLRTRTFPSHISYDANGNKLSPSRAIDYRNRYLGYGDGGQYLHLDSNGTEMLYRLQHRHLVKVLQNTELGR